MRFERFRRVRYLACAGIGVLAAATIAVLAAGGASGAPTTSRTLARFSSAGTYSWTVPARVSTVTFDVFGASGGNAANGSILVSVGGAGGEAKARFAVAPGQTFEVVVGGRGSDQINRGFNGGGLD